MATSSSSRASWNPIATARAARSLLHQSRPASRVWWRPKAQAQRVPWSAHERLSPAAAFAREDDGFTRELTPKQLWCSKGRVAMKADNPTATGVKRAHARARFEWLAAV